MAVHATHVRKYTVQLNEHKQAIHLIICVFFLLNLIVFATFVKIAVGNVQTNIHRFMMIMTLRTFLSQISTD